MPYVTRIFKYLIPILYGFLMYVSYKYMTFLDPAPVANFYIKVIGKEGTATLLEYINARDRVMVMNVVTSLPIAIVISFLWVFLAKYIPIIRARFALSILCSLLPLLYLWGGFIYLNYAVMESELAPFYPTNPYLWVTDTLAAAFLPYYFMLLIFKWLLIKREPADMKVMSKSGI